MNIVHERDNLERPFALGGNLSPQDLHIALLERNRQPTILFEDEAAGFFKTLVTERWMQAAERGMTHFYEGRVGTISKVRQAHLKGKSGLTSFNVHLYSTPENFFELVTDDQFLSGFLARMLWVIGEEPEYEPNSIRLTETRVKGSDATALDPIVEELGVLFRVLSESLPDNIPVYTSPDAIVRQEQAANQVRV